MSKSEQLRSPVMFYGSKARIADRIVACCPSTLTTWRGSTNIFEESGAQGS